MKQKGNKPEEEIGGENIEKLAQDDVRLQEVMRKFGSVEQVRMTVAEHGLLEHGKGLWDIGQDTRDAFPVNRVYVVWDLER